MATKKYLSLDRLTEYDGLLKADYEQKISDAVSGKANSSHTHDDRYYTETEIDSKIVTVNQSISELGNDISSGVLVAKKATQDANGNVIADIYATKQNLETEIEDLTRNLTDDQLAVNEGLLTVARAKQDANGNVITETYATKQDVTDVVNSLTGGDIVVDEATRAESAVCDGNGNDIDITYETKADATAKLNSANTYTDTKIANLINSAPTTLDTLGEIATAMQDNADVVEALEASIGNKSDIGHLHDISAVQGLQSALDGKAASSHGTHVTYSTTAPKMNGTAAVGTATTVSRSDHVHPVDTSRASKTEFDTHTADTTKHITSTERTNWNAAYTHSTSAHAPSNAEKNQNAFSNITVGSTTVAADTTTDTITFVGSNVIITPDATNDKITFAVAAGSTSTAGILKLTNSTSSTSTTTAATPNSVKSAYDLANQAKTAAENAQSTADSNKVTVDSTLSSTSTNPVQNKVLYTAIDTLNSTNTAQQTSIDGHSTRLNALETKVGDGFVEITSAEIQALFTA